MARSIFKLNALAVQKTKDKGLYADGNGLYLQVTNPNSKSWILRFMINGKARSMGLGSANTLSLSEARQRATEQKKLILDGIDPIEYRNEQLNLKARLAKSKISFDDCAKAYIESHKAGWKNQKHTEQWENTLATYVSPIFGHLPVADIDVAFVLKAIQPIWLTKTETASRVRNRIELILDWATVHGYCSGENPARWRGRLDKILPKRSTVQPVCHQKALPVGEISTLMNKLENESGLSAIALRLLILTATRTSEVLQAKWDEINFETNCWTIPASRMKTKKEHRVPLSIEAMEILKILESKKSEASMYIFPGHRANRPLSNMSMLQLLKRMKYKVTVHGFRSTFRDWAGEYTNHSREIVEMALAHTIQNKVEAAYRRGDLFLKRTILMRDWASFCLSTAGLNSRILKYDERKSS